MAVRARVLHSGRGTRHPAAASDRAPGGRSGASPHARGRPLTRRELLLAALAAVLLALVMHWALPLHIGSDVPRDLGDPLPQAWEVGGGGDAPLHPPPGWFQANIFWPVRTSLAFSAALVGYAPFGIFGSGVHAAVARYDVLFLFAYALAFFGAYLLARELGAGRAGASVAGAAFAYAPWGVPRARGPPRLSRRGLPPPRPLP